MRRLLLISGALLVAGMVAAAPAIAGLAGNPSFSHDLPVQVPTQAKSPQLADDQHRDRATASATPVTTAPGDDRGGVATHVEPGDDRGGATTTHVEPGDDRGTDQLTESNDNRGPNRGPNSSSSTNSTTDSSSGPHRGPGGGSSTNTSGGHDDGGSGRSGDDG